MDIFVGSLPFKLKENELREIFEKFGEVASVKIIINKATRQSKGFGFVEMPDEKQAINAIESLNGSEVMGRTIVVSRSEERKEIKNKENHFKAGAEGKEGKVDKKNITWRKNFFRKKKKESVIGRYDDDKKDDSKKNGKGSKSPFNFTPKHKRRR